MKYLSILLIIVSGCVTVKPKTAPDKNPGPLIPFVFRDNNSSWIDKNDFPIRININRLADDNIEELVKKAQLVFNNSFYLKTNITLKVTLVNLTNEYAYFEVDCLN